MRTKTRGRSLVAMDAVSVLLRMGGVARRQDVVRVAGRWQVDKAASAGLIVVRGRTLTVPQVDEHLQEALRLTGVSSHLSAAIGLGLQVKTVPDRPWVTVPRSRTLRLRTGAHVAYADLAPEDVAGHRTTPMRTVLDCARRLPFDEALAVADSALRAGLVGEHELAAAALRSKGPGSTACREVAFAADGRAANPFESALRALALELPALDLVPQAEVDLGVKVVTPDLVDRGRRLVVEADSHEFHTGKAAHDSDCERFTRLGLLGWLVLRFSWEQVMLRPDYVRGALRDAVSCTDGRLEKGNA